MKLLILTSLAIVLLATTGKGQTKLPDTIRLKLSSKELISISTHIDSLQAALANTSTLQGVQIAGLNQRLQIALYAIWKQLPKQMVVDTAKKGAGK